MVSSCSPGRGAESIAFFRVSHAVLALLSAGCQVAFPLDGYDDGSSGADDTERCKTAFLCEDFESGIDPVRWEKNLSTGSSLVVDEARFHGGKSSLHATAVTQAPGVEAKAQLNHEEPTPEQAFVRFYAWVEPPAVDDVVVSVFMQGGDPFLGMNLRVTPLGLLTLTNWAEEPDGNYDGSTSIPPDKWACVEWSVDRTTGKVSVIQDGEPSVSFTAATLIDANWFQIGALLTYPGAGDETRVWVDDLVIDTTPIGCP